MSIEARLRVERGDFSLDVDLSLPEEGITAVFGPSGCGKTTLLRAMAGLERDARGYLWIGNECWQDEARFLPTHKRRLGYVFQEPSLFPHLTVAQNLSYGLRRLRDGNQPIALDQAVELLGIGHLLERRPHQLSGGEQQRVAIARALAADPAILLLDEPLAAVDQDRKQEILPYLEHLHRALSMPVIYVSHARDEVARLADHMVLLENGRASAVGAATALFSRLDLPLAHGPDTETVIDATVAGHDTEFGLTWLDSAAGRFVAVRQDLSEGSPVRLQVLARDVSLTLGPPRDTSILNSFPAIVDTMADEGIAQTTVRLSVGSVPILARITRKSAVELGLGKGTSVHAQIKSVALLR